MTLIKDIEIDFNNEEDLLNGKPYSETLKNLILQENKFDKSLVIGVLGEWGSGKSSIIKTTQSLIKKDKEGKNIKFITYDAWKYVNDSFRRMFLLKIQEELKFKQTDLMERFYTNKSEDIKIDLKFNKSKFLWIFIITVIISIIIAVCFPHLISLSSALISLSVILSWLNFILQNCFDNLKTSQTTPLMFAPEQFEDCFNEMINETLKPKGWQKILKWINRNDKYKLKKLVIIIDNIDRCDSATATQLLNNIKSFLSDNPNVIFIIPTDDKSLCHHLRKSFSCQHSNAMEFLRKIFNVEIFIKPLCQDELFNFVKKINDKYKLGFSPDALSIIADTYASNPRRIIQFFNNAQIEIDIIKNKISDEEMDMAKKIICKLLIIKEENPEYYKQILNNYNLLNNYKVEKTFPENLDYSGKDKKEWIHLFLGKTSTFKLDMELVEKIISNSYVFSDITQEVKDAVRNIDLDIISNFINQSTINKEKLLDYIINKLNLSVMNNLWGSKVLELFRILLFINSISELSENINSRIQRELNDLYVFCNNIKLLDDNVKDLLTIYLNTLHKQKNDYLFKAIMEENIKHKFNDGEKEEEINLASNLFIKLLKINDTSLFKEYKQEIISWYIKTNSKLSELNLNNLDDIVSDELIDTIIQKISYENETHINEIIHIIQNRKNFDNNLYEKLFEKINSIYTVYSNSINNTIIEGINYVLSILNASKEKIKSKNFDEFLKIYFGEDIQYARNYYYIRNMINNELTNIEKREKIIQFLITAYKLTDNSDIISYLSKIINSYPNERNYILKELKEENISFNITPITTIILNSKLSTDEYCYWLKELSIKKDNDEYIINDADLSSEINNILSVISNNSDDDVIERLNNSLEFLLENRTITADEISKYLKNSNNIITKLSDKIKISVLDRICEFIKNYETDKNILKLIAQYGSRDNIKLLMNIILKNIVDDTKNMISLYKLIPINNVSKQDQNKINPYLIEE